MSTLAELRKTPHWSFSSVNTFLSMCSLKWSFRYLEKRESERGSISLCFGSAFHRAAEFIATNRMHNKDYSLKDAQENFSVSWFAECKKTSNLYLKNIEKNELNLKGQQMIKILNNEWVEYGVVAVSKAFSLDIPNVSKPLIGEMDCIVRDDNGLITVIDWKTAARKWSESKAHKDMQATTFLMAYKRLANFIPKFRFDVITKTKEPSFTQHSTTRNEDDFNRLEFIIQSVEQAIKAGVFLPNETCFCCGTCEYKSACKSWHRNRSKVISVAA